MDFPPRTRNVRALMQLRINQHKACRSDASLSQVDAGFGHADVLRPDPNSSRGRGAGSAPKDGKVARSVSAGPNGGFPGTLQGLDYRLRDKRLNVHACFDAVESQTTVKRLRHACHERNQDDVVPLSNHRTPPRRTLPLAGRGFNENPS